MRDKELFTVKEYSEAAGVTQQAVYKRLNKGLSKFVVEVDGQKFIKREALEELEAKRQEQESQDNQTSRHETDFSLMVETLSKTIDLLQNQLAVKDDQIRELNARLEQALNNTSQSHYIAAQAQKKALDNGEAGEEQEHSDERESPAEKPREAKRGLFSRLFGN